MVSSEMAEGIQIRIERTEEADLGPPVEIKEVRKDKSHKSGKREEERKASELRKAEKAVNWIVEKVLENENGDVEALKERTKKRFGNMGSISHIHTLILGIKAGLRKSRERGRRGRKKAEMEQGIDTGVQTEER